MKIDTELHFEFNDLLNEKDTDSQTFGCRANNPDICGNNGLSGVCAFANKDYICRKPSRAWKKQYEKLLGANNDIK